MSKITPDHVESVIESEKYIHDGLLTICILTLTNGFRVVGTSEYADPVIYSEGVGKIEARKSACNQIWPLEGYLLRQIIFESTDL